MQMEESCPTIVLLFNFHFQLAFSTSEILLSSEQGALHKIIGTAAINGIICLRNNDPGCCCAEYLSGQDPKPYITYSPLLRLSDN